MAGRTAPIYQVLFLVGFVVVCTVKTTRVLVAVSVRAVCRKTSGRKGWMVNDSRKRMDQFTVDD